LRSACLSIMSKQATFATISSAYKASNEPYKRRTSFLRAITAHNIHHFEISLTFTSVSTIHVNATIF